MTAANPSIEALNQNYQPVGAIASALHWLKVARECPGFVWDGDQYEFAGVALADAEAELRTLLALVDAQEADAKRYRWLRESNDWHSEPRGTCDEPGGARWSLTIYTPVDLLPQGSDDLELDAAIDSAMKETK